MKDKIYSIPLSTQRSLHAIHPVSYTHLLESTEVEPRYSIPKQVIDSLEGVEFLRKIGASLPPSMEDRVVDIDLRGTFDMKIVRGLTSAETEHVLCCLLYTSRCV